jgi:hypothetical protein
MHRSFAAMLRMNQAKIVISSNGEIKVRSKIAAYTGKIAEAQR